MEIRHKFNFKVLIKTTLTTTTITTISDGKFRILQIFSVRQSRKKLVGTPDAIYYKYPHA